MPIKAWLSEMLPVPAIVDRPFRWELFEIKDWNGEANVIAIGSLERFDSESGKRFIDVSVRNCHPESDCNRGIMLGGGSLENGRVKVTPGGVYNDAGDHLKYCGIGSLVFNVVIDWAIRTYPDKAVVPITLARQGEKESEPELKDRLAGLIKFYGRFGFSWDEIPKKNELGMYPSHGVTSGSQLRIYPEKNLHRVRRLGLPGVISNMCGEMEKRQDVSLELAARTEALTRHKKMLDDKFGGLKAFASRISFLLLMICIVAGFMVGLMF